MATLTVQTTGVPGTTVALAPAASLGDDVAWTDGLYLMVRNLDTVSHTVTLTTPGTVRGVALDNPAVVVTASAITMIPLPRELYRNASTGRCAWTYDAVTSVTVAAVKLPLP